MKFVSLQKKKLKVIWVELSVRCSLSGATYVVIKTLTLWVFAPPSPLKMDEFWLSRLTRCVLWSEISLMIALSFGLTIRPSNSPILYRHKNNTITTLVLSSLFFCSYQRLITDILCFNLPLHFVHSDYTISLPDYEWKKRDILKVILNTWYK